MVCADVNRWAVLAAVQTRLDGEKVKKYEAVLACAALEALFPADDGHSHNVLSLWVRSAREHLRIVADGGKCPAAMDPALLSALWGVLRKPTDRILDTAVVDELLASASGLGGTDADECRII